jgi:subtilisin family serine protease
LLVSFSLIGGPVYVMESYSAGAAHAKLDSTLRFLLAQQSESLAQTGRPLNLTPYANRLEVISRQGRMVPSASAAEPADRVAVLIRAQNVSVLKTQGIKLRAIAGQIATAHLTLAQLAKLAQSPHVIYIEVSKRLQVAREPALTQPELDLSLPETGAHTLHQQGITGRGVVVGVVDTGFDCVHEDFRVDRDPYDGVPEEGSRFSFLLDQTQAAEYSQSRIEQVIRSGLPCPVTDDDVTAPSHGTHVLGVAAGDGSASAGRYVGLAPEADIIAVKSTLSDAGILEGVRYIFDRAGHRPAVVNLSLGTQAGPHDGSSHLDQGLDALVGMLGRAIVVAAGNQGDDRLHVGGILEPGRYETFEVWVDPEKIPNELSFEFWYDGHLRLNVSVISPRGNRIGPVPTGQVLTETFNEGGARIDNASGGRNPNNGAHQLALDIFGSPIPIAGGTWRIQIEALGSQSGRYDGWSLDAPFFSPNADNSLTVGSPGAARQALTVGAYVTKTSWQAGNGSIFGFYDENPPGQIATFSSRGPTRDGRIKPDITAPGIAIASALAQSARFQISPDFILVTHKHFIARGTSFAAPHLAGAIALLFQQEPQLTAQQLKEKLKDLARRDDFTGYSPNSIWGAGKLYLGALPPPARRLPEEIQKIAYRIDYNTNNQLDDDEILNALYYWATRQALPALGRPLSDEEILALMDLWARGGWLS